VQRELNAARRLLASGQTQIDEVLSTVAERLAADLEAEDVGAEEESAPAAPIHVP